MHKQRLTQSSWFAGLRAIGAWLSCVGMLHSWTLPLHTRCGRSVCAMHMMCETCRSVHVDHALASVWKDMAGLHVYSVCLELAEPWPVTVALV